MSEAGVAYWDISIDLYSCTCKIVLDASKFWPFAEGKLEFASVATAFDSGMIGFGFGAIGAGGITAGILGAGGNYSGKNYSGRN